MARAATIGMDAFALRQFRNPSYRGTQIDFDPSEFLQRVQAHFAATPVLVPGYAEFCKHIFMPNFTSATVGAVSITNENKHLLASEYEKRRPEELAVLERHFLASTVAIPRAEFLDIILYSAEQMRKEYAAMPPADGATPPTIDYDWGIISVKGQSVDYEQPMNPITMLRNALGVEEGGSGVPLDRGAYERSVAFWSRHAALKWEPATEASPSCSDAACVCSHGSAGVVALTSETRRLLVTEYVRLGDVDVLDRHVPSAAAATAAASASATAASALPMTPIAMMRNALRVEDGGAGAALDRDAYERAVAFWSVHAALK
eukprot:Amastigsp_a174775_50.p1 type:complete len:318 gc:universal Amastigsp_a174775_50:971-18(-)